MTTWRLINMPMVSRAILFTKKERSLSPAAFLSDAREFSRLRDYIKEISDAYYL